MSLSKKIAAALDENTTVHVLPCSLAIEDGAHHLEMDLTSLDSVGLAFSSLQFATRDRSEWSSEALREWGERLARRVTYLMEPLKVLEIDAQGGEVQLRSESPTARDEQRAFYEVRLYRSGTLRMERRAYDEASRRRQATPCRLTREVLERLGDDIVASMP